MSQGQGIALPSGPVTFLMTDIEGSVQLWERDSAAMARAMARHDKIIEAAVVEAGGTVVRPRGEGDSRFCVFTDAAQAVEAAIAIQRGVGGEAWEADHPIRVRIGLYSGDGSVRAGDYYGTAPNRCARLRDLGHGGQILMSTSVVRAGGTLPDGAGSTSLGQHRLRGVTRPEEILQLTHPDLMTSFPPLRVGGAEEVVRPRPMPGGLHDEMGAVPLVRILGPLVVDLPDGPVVPSGRRERAVLAMLALEAGRAVSTDALVDFLWGDDPPRTAIGTLRAYVSRVRSALGDAGERIVHEDGVYVFEVPTEAIDVHAFRERARAGSDLLRAGDHARAAGALTDALAYWRADAPAALGDSVTARALTDALAAERLDTLEASFEARIGIGEAAQVIAACEEHVAAHPFRERGWMSLMRALYRCDRQADALEAFERASRVLVDELGLDPSPSLSALQRQILNHDPALAGSAVASSLPAETTSFVGRSDDLALVRSEIAAGHRLVTLTGLGGIGKSRLAVRAAQAADRPATFVPLRDVDETGCLHAMARALGVTPQPGDEPIERIADAAGRRLLILDNAEHVRMPVAVIVEHLLAASPDAAIVATSRHPLGIAAERVITVRPLEPGAARAIR